MSISVEKIFEKLDSTQVELMEEMCILINEDDQVIGSETKKVTHLLENINKGMLHRAFSVFLFNSEGKLLLQQRATEKITFPDHWTNTCCSHPLHFAEELDERDAIGVRRAAQRKLNHELGIKAEQVPLDESHYITRIHYLSPNVPYDGVFGEHEIDYILFIQRDVNIEANLNEVKEYRYVNEDELKNLLSSADTDGVLITPWFRLICDRFLFTWWPQLKNLKTIEDHATIHRMVGL